MDRDMIDKFSQEMARQYQTPNAPDTEKPDAEKRKFMQTAASMPTAWIR